MRSLTVKLTLAFLVVSLTGIALVAAMIWAITSIEFNRFLTANSLNSYVTTATDYYKANGSWAGVTAVLQDEGMLSPTIQPGANPGPPQGDQRGEPGGPSSRPVPFVLVDVNYRVVASSGFFHEGDRVTADRYQQKESITVNNQVVGYVLVIGGGPGPRPNSAEQHYLNQVNTALVLASLGAILIAVLLGLFLARTITHPVKELTAASRALARGNLEQQVPVRSKDELGELTRTFNTMSADLEHARRLRQQMTADIAHDLRTPLAVITGYVEGMKDGILKPTQKRFDAMYDEAMYLGRLIEDLRTLSLADAGELSMNYHAVQPVEIIDRLATAFQQQVEQKRINLKKAVEKDLPAVRLDPERMQQVLDNLVSNALRYTPAGGEIILSTRREDSTVRFEVKDNGAGISSEALEHIFDRFYRGDESRQEGGSGLGLAIAKSLVELQGGKISASSAGPGTGSQFTIEFPC